MRYVLYGILLSMYLINPLTRVMLSPIPSLAYHLGKRKIEYVRNERESMNKISLFGQRIVFHGQKKIPSNFHEFLSLQYCQKNPHSLSNMNLLTCFFAKSIHIIENSLFANVIPEVDHNMNSQIRTIVM